MQEIHEIECPEEIDLSQVQQHLKDAISKQNELKTEGKQLRKKYLLDYHLKELNEKQLQNKKRKKLIKGIQKNLQCKHSFHYLTQHVGKGAKNSIKRLHEVDQDLQIIKTHMLKEDIK